MVKSVRIVALGLPHHAMQRGNRVGLTFAWADVVIYHAIFPA
jgi:hypothetical protein